MAESIDTLQRQVNKLSLLLQAQQRGLPSRLIVFVTGEQALCNDGVNRMVESRLRHFGLEDESQAVEAGCEITVAALPWLTSRAIGR